MKRASKSSAFAGKDIKTRMFNWFQKFLRLPSGINNHHYRMKRVMIWLICLCGLFMLTGGDAFAQYNQTKCPPKKKSWKVRKSLIKFPELIEQEKEKERIVKQKRRHESAEGKEEKTARVKPDRKPLFSFDRRKNLRWQKVDSKEVASTKCPK